MAQRNAEALPLLQRAVQEAPKFVATHRALIQALTRLGRLEEAREAAARLLEIRPDYRVSPASTIHFSPAFTEPTTPGMLGGWLSPNDPARAIAEPGAE